MLSYDIVEVKESIENMKDELESIKRNKDNFLNYIDSNLVMAWNTTNGKVAIEELKKFIDGDYQKYIDFLNSVIINYEQIVIPGLENIDKA